MSSLYPVENDIWFQEEEQTVDVFISKISHKTVIIAPYVAQRDYVTSIWIIWICEWYGKHEVDCKFFKSEMSFILACQFSTVSTCNYVCN